MRIIPQEELDAATPYLSLNAYLNGTTARYCEPCAAHVRNVCTDQCLSVSGADWFWHGFSGEHPTPESALWVDRITCDIREHWACSEGHGWFRCESGCDDYLDRVHARAATMQQALGDFDEEAERARLMPV